MKKDVNTHEIFKDFPEKCFILGFVCFWFGFVLHLFRVLQPELEDFESSFEALQ